MIQQNGYFQVEIINTRGRCQVYPPTEGGDFVDYKEITGFLDRHGFKNYNIRDINDCISNVHGGSFDAGECDGIGFSESMVTTVSLDKMTATCRFYPGTIRGNRLTVKDIIGELTSKGIRFGIDQNAIMDFMTNPAYCTDYVVAQGTPPVHGKDASIEFYFNTNPSLQPKHNEDGSVDYRNLNIISHVNQGDLLATLHKEDRGKPGKDVTGRDIPPRSVTSKKLEYGRNIRISEDSTELFSEVTGHASLVDGKVFVSDVYEVAQDVDNSIGNITYNGNVHVAGSVRGGFIIDAKGDVVVDGVVEDALIRSQGQIIVKCGIHGMKRGILEAQGNVITKFIENAMVFAGGYIETGAILYSDVSASHDIFVNEKKGIITGGSVRAGGKIEAQYIGSEMGAATTLEVGMAPDKKEEYLAMQQEIKSLSEDVAKIQPIISNYKKFLAAGKKLDKKNSMYLNQLVNELKEKREKLEQNQVAFKTMHTNMTYSNHAKVVVKRTIHSGVSLTISDVSLTTKDERSYCQFVKQNGEIKVENL